MRHSTRATDRHTQEQDHQHGSARIDLHAWDQHAASNRFQTIALLLFMAALMALLGWLFFGPEGILLMLVTSGLMVLVNPVASPRWIMSVYGARPIARSQAPTLHAAVDELAQRAGLESPPTLHYVPSRMINAFAVGRMRGSAIAITDGLLRNLDLREQIAVLAHEISHVRNNDMAVMGLADMFGRLTSLLALLGKILLLVNLPLLLMGQETVSWVAIVLLVFAPTVSALAQLGLSRTREYHADLNAARLTGDPEGLARALTRIERVQGAWLERLLMPGRQVPEPSILRTHPPLAERVERLRELRPRAEHELQAYRAAREARMRPHAVPGRRHGTHPLRARPVTRKPRWHHNGLWH